MCKCVLWVYTAWVYLFICCVYVYMRVCLIRGVDSTRQVGHVRVRACVCARTCSLVVGKPCPSALDQTKSPLTTTLKLPSTGGRVGLRSGGGSAPKSWRVYTTQLIVDTMSICFRTQSPIHTRTCMHKLNLVSLLCPHQ